MFPHGFPVDGDAHDHGGRGALGHLQPDHFLGGVAGPLQPVGGLLVRVRLLAFLVPYSDIQSKNYLVKEN